jgi:hypothetical protein
MGIVVAVAIIGAGAYVLMGNKGTAPDGAMAPEGATVPTQAGTQQPATSVPTGNPMSLKELLASGTSQQCTFADNVAGATVQGTVYVSGGKVRIDFSSTQQGKTVSGHTMTDGDVFYTWSDGMKDGFKMSMTAAQSSGTQQQMLDVDRKVDYHCSPWTSDTSIFALPKHVTFRDMAEMMKGVKIPGATK